MQSDFLKKIRFAFAGLILLLIPLWLTYVVPETLELAEDFRLRTEIDSYDNFYDPVVESYTQEQRSVTDYYYETVSNNDNVSELRSVFDVRTLSGEQIFSVERLYGVDARSRQHVSSVGDKDREGFLFGPRMKGLFKLGGEKESFTYWHINYDTPILMDYRSEVSVYGLKTYLYESNFSTDQTTELTGILDGVGEDLGVVLDVNIKLWVEPFTGRIVQYEDAAEAFYYDLETRERLYPWNKFHNRTNPVSAAEQAKVISVKKQLNILYEFVVPIVLFIIAFFLLFYAPIRKGFLVAVNHSSGSFKNSLIPLFSGLLIFAATVTVAITAHNITNQQIEAEFTSEAVRVTDSIKERLEIYANALRGGRGLFDASDFVSKDEWKVYVDSLNLQVNYPGIQGIGFAEYVTTDTRLRDIEIEFQEEGFDTFGVFPEGSREVYTPVMYIEPFDLRNRLAFGYDMFSEENRRNAMEFARDAGDISVSKRVVLVQEGDVAEQAGFLMYEPVYANGTQQTLDERRDNIFGYVYAAFRMDNLMIGIFSSDNTPLNVEIFDTIQSTNLLDSDLMFESSNLNVRPEYTQTEKITLFNNVWTIRYTTPQGYGYDVVRSSIPIIILFFGAILSLAVFILIYTINTRRSKAIALAKTMTRSLSTEKARTEAILSSVGEGLFVTDKNKKVIFVNKAFETIMGYKASEVIGKNLTDVITLQNSEGKVIPSAERPLSKVLKNKRKTTVPLTKGYMYKNKKGVSVPVTMVLAPILVKDEFVGAVEVFRDVTREMEIDKAKSEFVSLASHQLKTPLTSINWYTEMLLEDKKDFTKQQVEHLTVIDEASDRMSELVNSLLNVSRLELGTFMIEPQKVNLKKLISSTIAGLKLSLKARKQKIKFTFDKTIPELSIDPQLTNIVVLNLLTNASKYSPEKTTIELDVSKKGRKVVITCTDHGYGIPPAQQKLIFTKLFRADNVQTLDVDGTGLGLYIVKTIADVAGCTIKFTSKEKVGTTFTFTLPLSGMKYKAGSKRLFESADGGDKM